MKGWEFRALLAAPLPHDSRVGVLLAAPWLIPLLNIHRLSVLRASAAPTLRTLRVVPCVLFCLSMMLSTAACGNAGSSTTSGSNATKNATATAQTSASSYSIAGHAKSTATPLAASNPGSAPGNVPAGSGSIPAGLPHYFSFGTMSSPGGATLLDSMRSQNGTSFAFRYQYLAGGVNTHSDWTTWNQPAGQFATYYMQESSQHGYIPTFVYYELCQSNGAQPGNYCSGHDAQQDPSNIANPSIMNAYYANWALLMQKIGAFGKPTLVIVEPDLWGFLQHVDKGIHNASNVPASVKSSGYPDAAAFPDTAQGFAWALLHIRDKYARNAVLAIHASEWAVDGDIGSNTDPHMDVARCARDLASFLNSAGLTGTPAGVSTWDLISNDVADHDSAQPGGSGVWWDRYNRTFPNFARYLTYIGLLSQNTHRHVIMWQVPVGNQYFDTMNNSPGHYQDNRAEYILGNVASFAQAGIIAVLFGAGNGGTSMLDAAKDGVTNPAPISTYECNYCNTHRSSYPDDDGGYLRLFIGQYMQHPVPIQ